MPLSGTPAPYKRKKPTKIITDFSHLNQDEPEPETSELDLGTKIRAPKDIMLEELSLLKNKGSKMFKMRQQRVAKFVYENNPDLFSSESMENFQKLVPTLGGEMMDVGGRLVSRQMVGHAGGAGRAPVPPPKPGSKGAFGLGLAGGVSGFAGGVGGVAGGGGGQILDVSGLGGGGQIQETSAADLEKAKKKREYIKIYVSPWERAMKGNEELTATMRAQMPGPCDHLDLPKFKCFNRRAVPFGGFEKASQLMTFQLPEVDVAPEEPEPAVVYQQDIHSRPSFNRTPIGWVGSGETSHIHMDVETIPFDGETDDL